MPPKKTFGQKAWLLLRTFLLLLLIKLGFLAVACWFKPQQEGRICTWVERLRYALRASGDKSSPEDSLSYTLIGEYSEGLCRIKQGERYGFIDSAKRIHITPRFDMASDFAGGVARVEQDTKVGYIDREGQATIPIIYDYVGYFRLGHTNSHTSSGEWEEPLATEAPEPDCDTTKIELNGKVGLIDITGRILLPPRYDKIDYDHGEDEHPVSLCDKWGVLSLSRGEIIPPQYEEIRYFAPGKYIVSHNSKQGIIDRKGRYILPAEYNIILRMYGSTLWYITQGELWGLLSEQGQILVSPRYHAIAEESHGRIAVSRDGLWGFIDRRGRELIKLRYQRVRPFGQSGQTVVHNKAGERILIDSLGKELRVLPPADSTTREYDYVPYPLKRP